MVRNILGAIAGYVVMVVVVMLGIGAAWMVLGGTGAFDGEGPLPSTPWMVCNIVFGFLAALAGGAVARKVGRSMTAVKILVALMLLLGGYLAVTAESSYAKREPVDKPVAEMSFMEAGRHAKAPAWYNFLMPVVGAIGAAIGGRRTS
jgi:undecaprenyl pyrophosphate phosphatase UppP